MNVLKLALLGTVALAAVSVGARANDLSKLKAQIEALNSRISQLESAPSVPAGYQMLSISEVDAIVITGIEDDKGFGKKATSIGILPTADVPASTEIQWTGFVRAGVVYQDYDKEGADIAGIPGSPGLDVNGNGVFTDAGDVAPVKAVAANFDKDSFDIVSRASLKVVAKTDTAVGEVGVRVVLLASVETYGGLNRSHDSSVATDGYWGWWKMTPELELAGGVAGTLADSSNTFKDRCKCNYIDTGGDFGKNDPSQLRLTYTSGPIAFAVAVEDYDNLQVVGKSESSLGFAGDLKWSGDGFGFDINAGYWDTTTVGGDADWVVNAGAKFELADVAKLGLAVGMGESGHKLNDDFTRASMYVGFDLSDAIMAEFGVTYTDRKDKKDNLTLAGGVYYTPVDQLTLGFEASHSDTKTVATDVKAAFITEYRF